jgi:hypothetical protein
MARYPTRTWVILTDGLRALLSPVTPLSSKDGAQLKRHMRIPVWVAQAFWATVSSERVDSPSKKFPSSRRPWTTFVCSATHDGVSSGYPLTVSYKNTIHYVLRLHYCFCLFLLVFLFLCVNLSLSFLPYSATYNCLMLFWTFPIFVFL